MSCKIKCVQLNLEDSLYDHINEYIESYIPDIDISYFLKCCLINHLINLNVLDQCGMPNPLCLPPKLDFSKLAFNNLENTECKYN